LAATACHVGGVPHVHPTVLVVDDHDDVRDALALLVRIGGYAAETARDGRDALQKMRDAKPCLILLDLAMPDMSGEDFRAEQLADDELRDIPVVVVSASPDIKRAAARMRASAYAEKPVNMQTLATLVPKHCLK
jgi:CheY-like chemotaxis protein